MSYQDNIKSQKEKREGCNAGTPAAWGAPVAGMLRMRTNDIRPLRLQDSNRQHVQVTIAFITHITYLYNVIEECIAGGIPFLIGQLYLISACFFSVE